jgi:Staphylococcal nuclease homologue.
VYNLQGQNLSAHLLAQGLGWHIAVPPNLKLAKCLSTIEAEARSKKLGLWNLSPTLSTEIRRGGFQHIEARIRDISFGKPGEPWWVHLDNSLLAVIYPENQQYFDRTRLASLKGRRVEIRGWVYPDRRHTDRWRIKLETPFAIASPF